MRTTTIAAAALVLLSAIGCKNNATTASNASTPSGSTAVATGTSSTPTVSANGAITPEDLGTLGAQIRKQPNDADRLLAQRGLTRDTFEQAIRKVSEDPADRRAVLVGLTPAGEDALAQLRSEYRALLHDEVAELDDHQIETLASAVQILDSLIERLSAPPE